MRETLPSVRRSRLLQEDGVAFGSIHEIDLIMSMETLRLTLARTHNAPQTAALTSLCSVSLSRLKKTYGLELRSALVAISPSTRSILPRRNVRIVRLFAVSHIQGDRPRRSLKEEWLGELR